MKTIQTFYVFDASAKTVVFSLYPSGTLQKKQIYLITNVDTGDIIYRFNGGAGLSGTITPDAGGDILTLDFNTTDMDDADELMIILDDLTFANDIFLLLDSLNGKFPNQGQATKAASIPVALASDQELTLPAGAATEAKQDDAITQLTSIAGEDFATETTLALIKAKTDNLDMATSALRDALRGAGSKTITDLETDLAAIKTAVEVIDNFISGTKGLVTEDNSAAIKTAVETIDNFISGSRGLVTEDNSAAIKTSVELLDDAVIADNAQFTDGTTKLHMKGFIYDEVAGTALTENDAAAARINANRAQVGALEDGTTRGRYATVTAANALKVDASGVAIPITDNSSSLTVDAPVGTPVNVQIGNATLSAGVIDETGSGAVDALAVGGGTAHDAVDSGNPIKVGAKAANALPTAVASGDRANNISDLWGRVLTAQIDPAMQLPITKTGFNATTTQTGAAMLTPTSGKRFAITHLAVSSYGTTGARVIIWIGASGDTTYSAGTDHLIWAGSFVPSATVKPGAIITPAMPWFSATADHVLKITTDAGISIDVSWNGYEFT